MKEAVTKFDFESAFKALDEIEIPVAEKVRANRPALTEIFSHKTKFDSLMEEYYDINDTAELNDAKDAREAEVAKAKLARIEKIVDLDADSPEDLLTSYVGKYIMQCPQCMTLFYKDPEDVVEDEEDPSTVNVNEVCQHCGNESGYTLIGKVGEAEPDEMNNFNTDLAMPEEAPGEDTSAEEPTEEEDLDIDLDAINLEDEEAPAEEEEEKKEESFVAHGSEALVEELADDIDLDAKLEAHSEYIEYLRTAIAQEEEKLEKATNEQVKVAIQRNIDAFKADLETALPDAVKNEIAEDKNPAEKFVEENAEEEPTEEIEAQEESCETPVEGETLTEALHEEKDLDVSADEFEELINSPEFKKPISDTAVRDMINSEKEDEEEKVEESLTEGNLLDLGKAIGKKVGQIGKALKNKASAAIDKLTDDVKTREEKADWLLANTLKDYSKVKLNDKNELEPDEANRKFKIFVVIGSDSNEKNVAQEKSKYSDADSIAKGWSMQPNNGPATIYLAKDKTDNEAWLLCRYVNGNLDNDQLDKHFKAVKSQLEGGKLMAKGGVDVEQTADVDASDTTKLPASKVAKGMIVKNANRIASIVSLEPSPANKEMLQVVLADMLDDELEFEYLQVSPDFVFNVLTDEAVQESLETVMSNLEELQESELESLVSSSLVEAYGNVAGFRLTECAYTNNKFTIDGTIYFTSGNTRKTTYTFNESFKTKDGKVSLLGINEKLGLDRQFTLTGRISDKAFITESFKRSK